MLSKRAACLRFHPVRFSAVRMAVISTCARALRNEGTGASLPSCVARPHSGPAIGGCCDKFILDCSETSLDRRLITHFPQLLSLKCTHKRGRRREKRRTQRGSTS